MSGVSLSLASFGPKQVLLALAISQPSSRQTVEGIRDLILAHLRTQPFRRGRWHLQSAIAEVARRDRSRSPSRHQPAPENRQYEESCACRRRANDWVEAAVHCYVDLAPPGTISGVSPARASLLVCRRWGPLELTAARRRDRKPAPGPRDILILTADLLFGETGWCGRTQARRSVCAGGRAAIRGHCQGRGAGS